MTEYKIIRASLAVCLIAWLPLAGCGQKTGDHAAEKSQTEKTSLKQTEKRDAAVTRKVNAEKAELVGEVIDAWCYCSKVMGDGRGKEHEKCAKLCVAGGVSAGILTDDGTVYIAAKHQGYKGANGILLPYVAKRVRVKGWVAERGGIKVVKVREVELIENKSAEATNKTPESKTEIEGDDKSAEPNQKASEESP